MSGQKQIEQLLIDAGYTDETEQVARDSRIRLDTDRKRHLKFLKDNKPWAAEQVAIRAVDAGKAPPAPVVTLARKLESWLGIEERSA